MSVATLREIFNAVMQEAPAASYTCDKVTLSYKREHDTEFQIIRVSGTGRDGEAFDVTSSRLRPNTDLRVAIRAMAEKLKTE